VPKKPKGITVMMIGITFWKEVLKLHPVTLASGADFEARTSSLVSMSQRL
jgi:hypothetical protein